MANSFNAPYADRINRLKEKVLTTYPEIDLENARILTQSFHETEGEVFVLRKAKAFRRQCQEKTVEIWDDELIVGNAGSKIRGGILSADVCWSVLDKELTRSTPAPTTNSTSGRRTGRSSRRRSAPIGKGAPITRLGWPRYLRMWPP